MNLLHSNKTSCQVKGVPDCSPQQKLDDFLNQVMSRGLIGDGTVAPDVTKVIICTVWVSLSDIISLSKEL